MLAHLGTMLAQLGAMLAHLGAMLGPFWRILGLALCWATLTHLDPQNRKNQKSKKTLQNAVYQRVLAPILGLSCPMLTEDWPGLGLCWPILELYWPNLGLCWPIVGPGPCLRILWLCWPILEALLALCWAM